MPVTTREDHMQVGGFSIDLDFSMPVYDELVDEDGWPRKVHFLIYDADGNLACYPLILLGLPGGAEGLTATGTGPLWHLGLGAIGPMITYREYVSGSNKLGNGLFLLDDLYWRRPSQGSLWVPAGGLAVNPGGLTIDDVLESDEPFGTLPGHQYRLQSTGVTGLGRWRQRVLFKGRFNPENLLVDGSFELGVSSPWLQDAVVSVVEDGTSFGNGTHALRWLPIPQPQLVDNSDMEQGPFVWSGGTVIEVVEDPANAYPDGGTWVMRCLPNPKPQYMVDPSLESGGAGWTDVSEFPTDMEIVEDPGNAASEDWVMRVGPVTMKQILANADFEDGLTNWWRSSNGVEDDPDTFESDPPIPDVQESYAAVSPPPATLFDLRAIKYLRADSDDGTFGVQAYIVSPGESHRLEGSIRAAPNTDGYAYLSLVYPHPTLEPLHPTWYTSQNVDGERHSTDTYQRFYVDGTVPAGRTKVYALFEVHNHTEGYWAIDDFTLTRTRGNRARIDHNTSHPVVANTRYELSALMRSSDEMQVGSVRMGVVLRGDGMPDQVVDVDKGSTDYVWSRVVVPFTPPDGYTSAQPFVAALDVVGAPVYVDYVQLHKVDNNSDTIWGEVVGVISDQRYRLGAAIRSGPGATKGTVRVGVKLTGTDLPDLDLGVNQGLTDGAWAGLTPLEVRAPAGYTHVQVYVRSTDVEGDAFWVDNVVLVKVDNNSVATVADDQVRVIPERRYRWTARVRSGVNLQRGTLKLAVYCSPFGEIAGGQRFESSNFTATNGEWTTKTFEFTSPSNMDGLVVQVVGTDVEGDDFRIDDMELRDADPTTMALDTVVASPTNATIRSDVTSPEGAEEVHVMVIAAAGTSAWTVGGVSFARRGVVLATGDAIADDLLHDPDTGLPLTIAPGTIDCPEVIPEDWEVINQTNHQGLLQYCNVISDPPREFDVTPTLPPLLNVGVAAAVFDDHGPASATPMVLRAEDVDVAKVPPSQRDVTERATEVRLAGNERPTVNGRPHLITASAQVPRTPQLDWNQNPVRRTKNVSDGTVDHQGYAQALANDLAARELETVGLTTFTLTGVNSRPPCKVGDWIYVHNPQAGMEDPENPMDVNGETIFPQRLRVLSRGRTYGPSHRIVVRREDGTTFDLPGVTWSDEDTTILTVGIRRPDWQRNASGPSAGVQYMRDRLSRPR